jgi:hypothetical protein
VGGFEVVDPRYWALFDRTLAVLGPDPRVLDVAVAGSIADGSADRWSDLDVQVVTDRDSYEAVLSDWPSWVGAITPTLFARTPIAPFIINTVTADGLPFDIAVYAGQARAPFEVAGYTVGLLSRQVHATVSEALEYAVAEQMRGLSGPFITLIGRDEHLRHLTGVPHLLGLLTTVFLAESDARPPGKVWNRTYTDEQRLAVAGLPPLRATREDVIAFGLGLAELLIGRARPLYPRHGLVWPSGLAAIAATRLNEALGIDATEWLY